MSLNKIIGKILGYAMIVAFILFLAWTIKSLLFALFK